MTYISFFNTISRQDLKIFTYSFVGIILSRGGLFAGGSAIDDYSECWKCLVGQGRPLYTLIMYVFYLVNINIADIYVPVGLFKIVSQALLVTSVFRFTFISNYVFSEWAALVVILHPYHSEILTFRGASLVYSLTILTFVMGLEVLLVDYRFKRHVSVVLLVTGLLMYQISINYIVITLLISILVLIFVYLSETDMVSLRARIFALSIAATVAIAISVGTSLLTARLFGVQVEGRAQLITLDMVADRVLQVWYLIAKIFIRSETIVSGLAKVLLLLMVAGSVINVVRAGSATFKNSGNIIIIPLAIMGFGIFAPGISVMSREWWPVPRVLNHVTFLYGFIIILGLIVQSERKHSYVAKGIKLCTVAVCFLFAFENAQIFADQIRINRWDTMQANRMVARLEGQIGFSQVKFLYVHAGKWGYAAEMRTVIGDMNISALFPSWSKVAVINQSTGYRFVQADGRQTEMGRKYCSNVRPWPEAQSVYIMDDLGIVCLDTIR